MKAKLLLAIPLCCLGSLAIAKPGIKSIVVFGDSLSANGNSALWAPNAPDPSLPPDVRHPLVVTLAARDDVGATLGSAHAPARELLWRPGGGVEVREP